MKVRVSYTIDASDDYRWAISHRYGNHERMATREEIVDWATTYGSQCDDDLIQEWQEWLESKAQKTKETSS